MQFDRILKKKDRHEISNKKTSPKGNLKVTVAHQFLVNSLQAYFRAIKWRGYEKTRGSDDEWNKTVYSCRSLWNDNDRLFWNIMAHMFPLWNERFEQLNCNNFKLIDWRLVSSKVSTISSAKTWLYRLEHRTGIRRILLCKSVHIEYQWMKLILWADCSTFSVPDLILR